MKLEEKDKIRNDVMSLRGIRRIREAIKIERVIVRTYYSTSEFQSSVNGGYGDE